MTDKINKTLTLNGPKNREAYTANDLIIVLIER